MTNTAQALAARLKSLRAKKKISQDKLAELSGIPRNTIAKIETGGILRPHPDTITALALHVGSTFDFLSLGVVAVDRFDDDVRSAAIAMQRLPFDDRKDQAKILSLVSSSKPLHEMLLMLEQLPESRKKTLIKAFGMIVS